MAKTILCIDDSPTIRLLVRKTLEPLGYTIFEADDGKTGVEAASQVTADFVLVDVNMPIMNGFDCVKKLKTLPSYSATPMVFLTTETGEDKRAQGRDLGVAGWMVKPFEAAALVKIVKMLAG